MKREELSPVVSKFAERIYRTLQQVPAGKVTTYGDLAKAAGLKGARAVGRAMNSNPFAPRVPCHRVVRGDGSLGGFARGARAKIALLNAEGITIVRGQIAQFEKVRYRFE